jgi:DNA-binding transcriptional regulator LsrR (DeoR family)
VSGGAEKAKAIIATKTYNPSLVLITDEGAAKEILELICGNN